MFLPEFIYHQPASVSDALGLLEKGSNAVAMAGGTDLLVEMKKGLRVHDEVVSLSRIDELKRITEDETNVYIGACTTHNEIISSGVVKKYIPALADAASKIGSEQVRNTGTLGGNLCTAASCCDSAPVLLAMNASVEVVSTSGVRTIALSDFFTFNKKTVLKYGDLVTRVIIPKPSQGTGCFYEKFGLREAGSISVVSVAAMIRVEHGTIEDACVVIGAVAPTPRISHGASDALKGRKTDELLLEDTLLEEAGIAAVKDSIPIDDIRGGAQYRRDVLKVIAGRAIVSAAKAAILTR
ncbi:MAG: xanthine dehydrogenase family protein subunit M [bacterium]